MEMTLKDLFLLGGWAMWPLLVFSVATVSLLLERLLFVLTHNLKVIDLQKKVLDCIGRGNLTEAQSICAAESGRRLAAPIFFNALDAIPLGESHVERSFTNRSSQVINSLERGFDLMVALGSIAPITGFLGTVSGMISAFQSIANAADVNAQLVAGGIFEALITTAYGLAIAIIAITGYNILAHLVDRFTANLEEAGGDIITCAARANLFRNSQSTKSN